MKKTFAFLFCLVFTSLIYGQSIELSKLIPTSSSAIVDELRVLDQSANSTINDIYIGFPSLEPFQSQIMKIQGGLINENIYAGRDLFINERLDFDLIQVGEGNLFLKGRSSYPNVYTGKFIAEGIQLPTKESFVINTLSGRNISVGSALFDSPFKRGYAIVKRNIPDNFLGIEQASSDQNKFHIFFPWEEPTSEEPTENLCLFKGKRYGKCDDGADYCYDVRSKKLDKVYENDFAIYEKLGTAKFYCKPKEDYDTTGKLTSKCERYVVFSDMTGQFIEGYRAELPDTIITTISTGYDGNTPADKCNLICVNGGCEEDRTTYLYAVDTETQEPIDWNENWDEKCSDDDRTAWPVGSGLSCKAKEKIIDIYRISCYKDSGKLRRPAGKYYQRRKVLCRQYAHVHDERGSIEDLNKKDFFYPDFNLSYSLSYSEENPLQQEDPYTPPLD